MSNSGAQAILEPDEIMRMSTDIVCSFVSNNPVPSDALPELMRSVHATIDRLSRPESDPIAERPKPAVPISRSITDDHIICLEDGKKLKMLKRYLRSHYGLTPDDYRRRWGLPSDYPMVAPSYTKKRSEFAKKIGLGKGNTRSG